MLRLFLVRHAGTAATRSAAVPDDEPATADLPDLTAWQGRAGEVWTSPALRCRVSHARVEPQLRPWDLGRWVGRDLAELDLASWRADPAYDAHGGESLLALFERVQGLVARWQQCEGRLVAVTHAAVIKSAVVQALRAPLDAVWDVDVAPASVTELHLRPGAVRVVRVNQQP